MRRFVTGAAVVLLAAAAGGCAARSMTVSSHMERGFELSPYRTYDWGPADALPTGDPRLDGDPFFKDQVQGAVEKRLAGRGLALASAQRPDLLIHYHANVTTRVDADRLDRAYGYCNGGDCPGTVEYEAGTLVLDFIDARTNRLIWRGWAQQDIEPLLDDRDAMAEAIDEAIERMLQRLPPAR
jgi:hypothetical protein